MMSVRLSASRTCVSVARFQGLTFQNCCRVRSVGLRDRHAVGLQGDVLRFGATALAGVQSVDRRQLVSVEFEVEDVEVLGDAVRCCRCQRSMTWAGLFE